MAQVVEFIPISVHCSPVVWNHPISWSVLLYSNGANCLKQHLAIPILNIWKTCLYIRTWFLSVYNFQCVDIVWKQMAPFERSRMGALIGRFHTIGEQCTVYPKKYAHGFVVLCFVVVMQSFIMNSHEVFIHIHQGCFAGTGAIVRLPQCQWSKPDGYGRISQCITTTKHSKAKIQHAGPGTIRTYVLMTERKTNCLLWNCDLSVVIYNLGAYSTTMD